MAEKLQVFKCVDCGTIVEVLTGGNGDLACCGKPLVHLAPKSADQGREKHVPVIEKFNGGPVGLETIAAAISEEADTIMDVYEPYLLQLAFLERTPRGRVATALAYHHLNIPYNRKESPNQPTLWQQPQ